MEQDGQNMTARTGGGGVGMTECWCRLAVKGSLGGIGKRGQGGHTMTAGTGYRVQASWEQEYWDISAETERPEQVSLDRLGQPRQTERTGLPENDGKAWTAGTGQQRRPGQ